MNPHHFVSQRLPKRQVTEALVTSSKSVIIIICFFFKVEQFCFSVVTPGTFVSFHSLCVSWDGQRAMFSPSVCVNLANQTRSPASHRRLRQRRQMARLQNCATPAGLRSIAGHHGSCLPAAMTQKGRRQQKRWKCGECHRSTWSGSKCWHCGSSGSVDLKGRILEGATVSTFSDMTPAEVAGSSAFHDRGVLQSCGKARALCQLWCGEDGGNCCSQGIWLKQGKR